jgi:hypothetical protein
VVQVVEHFPRKLKALSSNPSTAKKIKKNKPPTKLITTTHQKPSLKPKYKEARGGMPRQTHNTKSNNLLFPCFGGFGGLEFRAFTISTPIQHSTGIPSQSN